MTYPKALRGHVKYAKGISKLVKILSNEIKQEKVYGFLIDYKEQQFGENTDNLMELSVRYLDKKGYATIHNSFCIKYNPKTKSWKETNEF
ncbi:MAG: hypothetical protein AABW81_00620 [Nanoarchaeota archaeon]